MGLGVRGWAGEISSKEEDVGMLSPGNHFLLFFVWFCASLLHAASSARKPLALSNSEHGPKWRLDK